MKHHLQFGTIKHINVPLYLHWSAIATAALILLIAVSQPVIALIYAVPYFGVLLIHEIGHAFVARKLNVEVRASKIGIIHRMCVYDEPFYEWEDVLISWGGVAAQLSIAIPVIIASWIIPLGDFEYANFLVVVLGYFNIAIAALNLLPISGLDGAKTWRVVPLLIEHLR